MLLSEYAYGKQDRLDRLPVEIEKQAEIEAEIRAMLPRLERMQQALRHIGAKTRWEELPNIGEEQARQAMRYCRAMRPQFTMLQLMHDTCWPIEKFEEAWIKGVAYKEEPMEDIEIKEVQSQAAEVPAPKKRGRKPGSKNKPKVEKKPDEAPKRRGRPRKAEEAPKAAPAPEAPKIVRKKKEELPYWLL